ncbi:MAG: aspartyl protease family protein [Pseudomonadota bacterium]
MRAFLALLLLLAGTAAAVDTAGLTLADDSESRWVPFTLTAGNQIRFAAMIDGNAVEAVLDTGASHSMLTESFAERSGRRVARRGQVSAIGGTVPLGWTIVNSIAFGGLERRSGGLNVVRLPGAVTGNGVAIDLLVGRDLLERFALDIDYAGRRFRLLRSGRMPFTGTRAPLAAGRTQLALVTELNIAGRRVRPIIVDTGDGTALTLSREVWRTLPLAPAPVMTTQLAYGVGGAVEAEVATLPSIAIGERRVADVGVWVERSGGFSDLSQSAGRIGSGFLQRYRVLLDPSAGHMILADAAGAVAPGRSTSGLQLALTGDRLRVLHVMRGSPAEAGGWRVDERICAVDGVTIASDRAAAARATWPFGVPGTTLRLTLCDGLTRSLTLRTFY